ncbi:DNA ligase-1 [Volucribacter psittacicida]|uniref:DNA ligase-1 n=1 Tax=Volucribacter psittacicida TaxID=203482 RepID=A0A4R1G4F2_9PAST|nr:DNA ligase [Volucribacter psittacicida]TCJ98521.1 DNA ligase-1 [Volucribacter psittacicida]
MRYLFSTTLTLLISLWSYANPPNLMLLDTYQAQDIQGWVMSEKLDGVRGYWDGKHLFSRNGYLLSPPSYFTQHFPPFAIDGELFSQRNQFEQISAIVRSEQDQGWDTLKLYVFDVPNQQGDLTERLQYLRDYLAQNPTPYIQIIPQIPIQNQQHLQDFLAQVEQNQGEGVVIRDPKAPYIAGRSQRILKVKSTLDEECTVIAHHQGQGQFAQVLGAITCENHRGQFKIGSGFNLAERQNPPAIGSVITYRYRGVTNNGKPRFATYWRQREK